MGRRPISKKYISLYLSLPFLLLLLRLPLLTLSYRRLSAPLLCPGIFSWSFFAVSRPVIGALYLASATAASITISSGCALLPDYVIIIFGRYMPDNFAQHFYFVQRWEMRKQWQN